MIPDRFVFACRVLTYLKAQDDFALKRVMMASLGMPRRYRDPEMHELACLGLVVSQRGPAGGYRITELGRYISLLDLYTLMHPDDLVSPPLLADWRTKKPQDVVRAYARSEAGRRVAWVA